ncbi:hypothetical protein [Flexibacterium corallicola]|uniref:hypothetical protein n=1 Tax=Flexibacterium corallicola TaxID=3037259 RepID=UPI00286EE26B|nr:hypothetical protein [Pseudovibrio sp. M1P-2-3]
MSLVITSLILSSPSFAQDAIVFPSAKPVSPFAPDVLDQETARKSTLDKITPPISYDPLSGYQGLSLSPTFGTSALSYAPTPSQNTIVQEANDKATLYLVARLAEDSPNLTKGLRWHIFKELPDGELEPAGTIKNSDAEFRLDPGAYLVHTIFGKVTATTRYTLKSGVTTGTILLNAGGIRLDSAFSDEISIPGGKVFFDIYDMTYDATGNRQIIASNVKPGQLVPISAGTYHVVSRFGEINAVVRAELHVQAGKLTEATLYHRAGEVTLKLVSGNDGISLANTSWTILTPGGDTVATGNGAFLDLALAAGTYDVLANNGGQIYRHTFSVLSGERNIEVEIEAVN